MKKTKDFDCVRMKHEIQAQLDRQFEGMSDEEIRQEQRRLIEEDPILGPVYRNVRTVDLSRV
jgi:hypothetical protein